MWFERYYQHKFPKYLQAGKVLVVYGPRRAGKTALIEHFLKSFDGKVYHGVGEDALLQDIFRTPRRQQFEQLFSGYDLLVFDEAQKLPDVGTGLKLIVDLFPKIPVIAGGSSSFALSSQVGEPLTGRHRPMMLYPLSMMETASQFGGMRVMENLEDYLIYGTYPETLSAANHAERQEYLLLLRNSYLYKDILELEHIRNSDKLSDLLRLLAFQVGREVSLNELSNALGLAKQTVARYLDLLEKSFVVRKVRGFSRNLRKEVSRSARYYFWDNGIRNAVINNFNRLSFRDDIGMLWENFLFMEREKKRCYTGMHANTYFWRTYDRKEIDLIEEEGGKLSAYEFKWKKKGSKAMKDWLEAYPQATLEIISRENFLDFVT
jgi:uncharacterized protein